MSEPLPDRGRKIALFCADVPGDRYLVECSECGRRFITPPGVAGAFPLPCPHCAVQLDYPPGACW